MRHAKHESLWIRFLRLMMPASGTHARAEETGEMPVYDGDRYDDYDTDDYEGYPYGGHPYPDRLAETRRDFSIERYYRNLPVVRMPSLVRPYVLGVKNVYALAV